MRHWADGRNTTPTERPTLKTTQPSHRTKTNTSTMTTNGKQAHHHGRNPPPATSRATITRADDFTDLHLESAFDLRAERRWSRSSPPATLTTATTDRPQRTEPARRHPPITAPKNTPETRQEHPATNPSTDDDPIDRVLALSAGGAQRWCPTGDSPLAVGTGLTVVVTRQGWPRPCPRWSRRRRRGWG